MVLESTMICLDNSEWMRNGDYLPTRLEAQQDAATLLCNDRTRGNAESTIGVLTMAGKGVELLVSPTEDIGKILGCFANIKIGGRSSVITAVQVASLALKHRKNKNGGQRIIVFIGSPVVEEIPALEKIGKLLKKNNIAVDVVSLGELDQNTEKLVEFIKAVNSNENSHLITVPAGVLPQDAIVASPLIQGNSTYGSGSVGGSGGGGAVNAFAEYGGVDPSVDPEMAMALRVSTEEARAKEEARTQEALAQSLGGAAATPAAAPANTFGGDAAIDEEDEEALMRQALELSMMEISTAPQTSVAPSSSSSSSAAQVTDSADALAAATLAGALGEEDEEEAALRIALALSMQSDEPVQSLVPAPPSINQPTSQPLPPNPPPAGSEFLDPAFVSELLGSVDVDLNDPLIQAALAQMGAGAGAESSEDTANARKRKGPDSDA